VWSQSKSEAAQGWNILSKSLIPTLRLNPPGTIPSAHGVGCPARSLPHFGKIVLATV